MFRHSAYRCRKNLQLLTLLVYDHAGSPRVGPQFVLTHGSAEAVAGCLDYVYHLSPTICPAAFMMDDSAAEQAGVRTSNFSDVPIFLCHTHLIRALRRRLGGTRYV